MSATHRAAMSPRHATHAAAPPALVAGDGLDEPLRLNPRQAALCLSLHGDCYLHGRADGWRLAAGDCALLPDGGLQLIAAGRGDWLALIGSAASLRAVLGLHDGSGWLPRWQSTFPLAADEVRRHVEPDRARIAPRMRLALLDLGQQLQRCVARSPGRSLAERQRALDRLLLARHHIVQRFAEDVSLESLAALCGCSRSHLRRTFESTFGESPQELLARVRLDEARRLMSDTDLSVAEVAARVGYAHASAFCRAFRIRHGRTPASCRESATAVHRGAKARVAHTDPRDRAHGQALSPR